ncbi:MAG: hypothetical protein Q9162_003660 [Coniocarpon cinnabarinum]
MLQLSYPDCCVDYGTDPSQVGSNYFTSCAINLITQSSNTTTPAQSKPLNYTINPLHLPTRLGFTLADKAGFGISIALILPLISILLAIWHIRHHDRRAQRSLLTAPKYTLFRGRRMRRSQVAQASIHRPSISPQDLAEARVLDEAPASQAGVFELPESVTRCDA